MSCRQARTRAAGGLFDVVLEEPGRDALAADGILSPLNSTRGMRQVVSWHPCSDFGTLTVPLGSQGKYFDMKKRSLFTLVTTERMAVWAMRVAQAS